MKSIDVIYEKFTERQPGLGEISGRLDALGSGHIIDTLNWEEFSYRPEVRFNIAYTDSEILLKYYVKEDYFKAEKTESNEMVCEDSCVEFFVSPAEDGLYYNFEFNGIGTCLLGSGTCRNDSKLAPVDVVTKVRRLSTWGRQPRAELIGRHSWEITLALPLEMFYRHKIESLKGKKFRANFYKCGDKLSVPHYVTWNRVETENPDYHRPEFFGILNFV